MEIRNFGVLPDAIPFPCLNDLQRKRYAEFLQADVPSSERKNVGLEALFREAFPVESYDGSVTLEYVRYELGRPRHSIEECKKLDLTYARPLKVVCRLRVPDAGVIEESVYLGEMPVMVGGGEFIINGAERVIIVQLHRSSGVDFSVDVHPSGKKLYSCRIVPERGSWIEMVVTPRDTLVLRIDRSVRMPATCLLRAMDPSLSTKADVLRAFYETEEVEISKKTGTDLKGRVVVEDVVSPEGETLLLSCEEITPAVLAQLRRAGVDKIEVLKPPYDPLILNTLREDKAETHEAALMMVYSKIRPASPASVEKAKALLHERFFDVSRFCLGRVGRFRMNRKFNKKEDKLHLTSEDVKDCFSYLLDLRSDKGWVDDIDHLGNRRLRTIDELLGEEIRSALLRLRRTIQERMSLKGKTDITPRSLISYTTVSSAIEAFFARGELSQLVDQTNPLSQLTMERRLSAMGPGGLHRKRAGFEARDVHASHYGRICPIETPEGANIGLIVHMGVFARVDDYGFLVTPYRKVKNGKILKEVVYLRADEEAPHFIASRDAMEGDSRIKEGMVVVRHNGDLVRVPHTQVDLIDVSSKQMVGVSASLIPFLEHDDANRALMGSNMQRQALPLVKPEPPLVGTGMEKVVAENSSLVVKAHADGVVTYVDAEKIVVDDRDVYHLRKFEGLNEGVCMNQKPLVRRGDKVKKGQIIADGPATCGGELSLGRNLLVAFMSWEGYNFEDAIIISERVLREDLLTSLHIEEFTVEVRETELGREEITRDIPNVSDRALANLDEDGIVRVGTVVKPGDILVGKISPKSRKELSPEEKLLRAIFGKSGEDVSNESLVVPPGVSGVVMGAERFSRKMALSAEEKRSIEKELKEADEQLVKDLQIELHALYKEIKEIVGGPLVSRVTGEPIVFPDEPTVGDLNDLEEALDAENLRMSESQRDRAYKVYRTYTAKLERIRKEYDHRLKRIRWGNELPPGVLEKVKVYVATRRRIAVGDKLAGRHGNKGVISKIVPEEDMPFLEDGTPVDIILNPLGVPSRMNVGQILETHLGWAAERLGFRAVVPPFDAPPEEEIRNLLREAGLPEDGKVTLYDGRTGEPFDDKVTVGYIYMMKLHHLVEDKVHARATGPYSLVTQQPLGGKSRGGGQRFGEMEVWALEAYGAAHMLQEMLTVKSDDVEGRSRMYEAIVKGENVLKAGPPASFKVLVNELRGLALDVRMNKKDVI